MKFVRFNYQLLWEQARQNAYVNFPQELTEIELLPFMNNKDNKHIHLGDLTSFNTHFFEQIQFHNNFIIERSGTSDNRPYTTTNTISETSYNESDQNIL